MIFKVSTVKKTIESVTTSILNGLLLVLIVPYLKSYYIYISIGLFIAIMSWKILYKDDYILENGLISFKRKDTQLAVMSILYVECISHFRITGFLTGDSVKDFYYIVTKDSRYRIDLRHKNENNETLVDVLAVMYQKEISYK